MEDFLKNRVHKVAWERMANEAISNPDVLEQLVRFTVHEDGPANRNATETLRFVFDLQPELLEPHLNTLIGALTNDAFHHVKRCIYRITQSCTLNEDQQGIVLEQAYRDLNDVKNPIAVRVFAMTTIYNISKDYPEIYAELVHTIRPMLEGASAGFKNRAQKILNKTWK